MDIAASCYTARYWDGPINITDKWRALANMVMNIWVP
jgi:hypothetical protein